MAKALRIDMGPREWNLLKMVANGTRDFKDLNSREKLMLYQSSIDITTVVPEEQLIEFEQQMTINNALEDNDQVRGLVRSITDRLKRELPV